jgi:hypothetical protein
VLSGVSEEERPPASCNMLALWEVLVLQPCIRAQHALDHICCSAFNMIRRISTSSNPRVTTIPHPWAASHA